MLSFALLEEALYGAFVLVDAVAPPIGRALRIFETGFGEHPLAIFEADGGDHRGPSDAVR
ncbi:hypothetical protein DYI37_04025 [Fulvimarina endophytica]|uniref:Uncharacterized protein n=1 Tax=Fulvimarina endophytica TaxID=2293836 RepID=A0A371X724_9HYPH|nr:hypothetical protein DYI37_04025 [Fulvimarina endophytica]